MNGVLKDAVTIVTTTGRYVNAASGVTVPTQTVDNIMGLVVKERNRIATAYHLGLLTRQQKMEHGGQFALNQLHVIVRKKDLSTRIKPNFTTVQYNNDTFNLKEVLDYTDQHLYLIVEQSQTKKIITANLVTASTIIVEVSDVSS